MLTFHWKKATLNKSLNTSKELKRNIQVNLRQLPSPEAILTTMLERRAPNHGKLSNTQVLDLLSASKIEYHIAGNFTTAIVVSPEGQIFSGCSHRSIEDRSVPIRGKSIALTRALNEFIVSALSLTNNDKHFVIR